MKRLIILLTFLSLFLCVTSEATATSRARAFNDLTGGTSTDLDGVAVAAITDDDLAWVIKDDIVYFYQFNSSSTDAESLPKRVRPDDYSSSGVWHLSAILRLEHLTEIDSTDGDDAYTMLHTDIGGMITNQGDDDSLTITLLEASLWYSSNELSGCITIIDVEGQTITADPADGTDKILSWTDSAGDSLDSPGNVGDLVTLCAVGDDEIVVRGMIGAWADGD